MLVISPLHCVVYFIYTYIMWSKTCYYTLYVYSTAQLQGNIRTRFRHVSHAFWTRPRLTKKGHGTHVRLVAALSQGFALAWTRLACVPDAFYMCFRRVQTLPWSWAELYCRRCDLIQVFAIELVTFAVGLGGIEVLNITILVSQISRLLQLSRYYSWNINM